LPAICVRNCTEPTIKPGAGPQGAKSYRVWPVLGYLDVDLSTDLAPLPPLVAPLISGHSDIAVGSRLLPGSRMVRGPKGEIISRCYNCVPC
jgi:hypothetical protein